MFISQAVCFSFPLGKGIPGFATETSKLQLQSGERRVQNSFSLSRQNKGAYADWSYHEVLSPVYVHLMGLAIVRL